MSLCPRFERNELTTAKDCNIYICLKWNLSVTFWIHNVSFSRKLMRYLGNLFVRHKTVSERSSHCDKNLTMKHSNNSCQANSRDSASNRPSQSKGNLRARSTTEKPIDIHSNDWLQIGPRIGRKDVETDFWFERPNYHKSFARYGVTFTRPSTRLFSLGIQWIIANMR